MSLFPSYPPQLFIDHTSEETERDASFFSIFILIQEETSKSGNAEPWLSIPGYNKHKAS